MNNIWLRKNEVDILRYLPYFLSKEPTFKSVNAADNAEHERLRLQIQECLEQLFLKTATWGLRLWEEYCGLQSDETLDYKTRRNRVLDVLNGTETVTKDFLLTLINRYVADKSGSVIEHYDQYYIDILLPDGKVTGFADLEKNLRTFMPAHLGWKYVAFSGVNDYVNVSGIVSGCREFNIMADTSYDLLIDGPAEPVATGIVMQGYEITIEPDLFK